MDRKRTKQKSGGMFLGLNITMRVTHALILVGVVLILVFGALFSGLSLGYLANLTEDIKIANKEQLRKDINDIFENSTLRYSNGNLISNIKTDLVRVRVNSQAIPKIVKKAIVSIEDENFYQHKGWVPKAVLRAFFTEAAGSNTSSGGSTLTQQLVKQQILDSEVTFKRKVNEILVAKQIEKNFTKDEILVAYLNVSPFGRNNKGENIAGIEAAAQGVFGKRAIDLNVPQSAFLAGLPQSPIVYSPYDGNGKLKSEKNLRPGLKKQQVVLFNMYREHFLTKKEYEEAKKYDLKQDFTVSGEHVKETQDSLYYAVFDEASDCLAREIAKQKNISELALSDRKIYLKYYKKAQAVLRHRGLKVTTTIDENIHSAMQQAVARFGYLLDDPLGNVVEVGNVLMDNATGAVLGFIGSRNYQNNQNNHAFDTKRSPGSSIKPLLVYAPAIETGIIGTETLISNFPAKYSSGQDIMHVDSKGTDEYLSVRRAIAESWNIPAYHIYQTLRKEGCDCSVYMKKMGFKINDYTIESLPMGGGVEASVVLQGNGFQTLANGGVYHKHHLIKKIEDSNGKILYQHQGKPVQVFSKTTASIINNLLRDVISGGKTTQFKTFLASVAPSLANADWIGKTGTTDNYEDAWLIVSTPKITLGSWAGYDDNHPMNSLTSYQNNSQYLAYLACAIHNSNPNVLGIDQKFVLDPKVIKAEVNKFTGQKIGKVKMDGQEIDVPSEKIETIFAKNGPKDSNYKFGIGGSDDNQKAAWEKIMKK